MITEKQKEQTRSSLSDKHLGKAGVGVLFFQGEASEGMPQ